MFRLSDGSAVIDSFAISFTEWTPANTDTALIVLPDNVDLTLSNGSIYGGVNRGSAYAAEVVMGGRDAQRVKVENIKLDASAAPMTLPGMGAARPMETVAYLSPPAQQRTVVRTGSYTCHANDGIVIMNGGSLICTLPERANARVGQIITIKNTHSSQCVVSPGAGLTIDGDATKSLDQWASARYVWTGGTSWVSV